MIKFLAAFFFVVFVVPALLSIFWWSVSDRPPNWRSADWDSAGILDPRPEKNDSAVYVMAARTGGLKGALSVHSWIVLKKPGEIGYQRFDKVGWGRPVRRNAFAPDGRWYSNEPYIVKAVADQEAVALIPRIEKAIDTYPEDQPGDYGLWPGPNSNSFVAHILRAVPEIDAVLPALAVGRDFLPGRSFFSVDPDGRDLHFSLYGILGVAMGARSGFELHFLGLVAGIGAGNLAIKLPGFGEIGI